MAIRIKTENYALVVEDTADTSNPLMYLPKSQTWYNEENLDQGYVKFYGTTGTNEDNVRLYSRFENNFSGFLLSECVDGDDSDTAFTASTFRAWCGAKLVGFNNAEQTALSKHGFIDYNDTTGDVTLVADTWTDVLNNGAGAFTNKTYRPTLVNDVIDTSTGYLDFSELTLGSQLIIRNDFSVTPSTNNALLEVRYLLGQGAGEYPLLFWSERLDNGSGIPYQRVPVFTIYMGDTNTQGGAGKLQMRLSSNGTLNNAGSYINIQLR